MDLIENIEKEYLKEDLPEFKSGDTVKVNVKVSEGNRERIQTFEGVIIAVNGVGINKTITVRKLSFGVGEVSCPCSFLLIFGMSESDVNIGYSTFGYTSAFKVWVPFLPV